MKPSFVREVAAMNIVEATARQRMARADRHNTRPAIQRMQYKPRDLVDVWFEPSTKDQKGWRGPAEILSINADDGNVTVRIQGRTIDRQSSEVREHIPYLVFASALLEDQCKHLRFLQEYCMSLECKKLKLFGLLLQLVTGWQYTKATESPEGYRIMDAAMIVAATILQIPTCTTVRMGRGLHRLQSIEGMTSSEIVLWHPKDIDEHAICSRA